MISRGDEATVIASSPPRVFASPNARMDLNYA
jgi:hypothetical protein